MGRVLLIAVALLASAARGQEPAPAADPREAAALAFRANETHCSDAVAQADFKLLADSIEAIAPALRAVTVAHEKSPEGYLLYWRGVLAQCLGRSLPAFLEFREFVKGDENRRQFPALVSDARRRMRLMERTGRVARNLGRVVTPTTVTSPVRVGLGGGYQLAVRDGAFHYGAFALDLSVGLVGPLRLWLSGRPAVSAPAGEPGLVSVSVPGGVGLLVQIEGPVRPTFGAAFHATAGSVLEDGAYKLVPLAGALGAGGVAIPLGREEIALRPTVEAGFLGRAFVARGLLLLEIGP